MYTVVVNGKQHKVPIQLLRHEDIVKLAFPDWNGAPAMDVTFKHAIGSKPEGTLAPALDKFAAPKDGTIFYVVPQNGGA